MAKKIRHLIDISDFTTEEIDVAYSAFKLIYKRRLARHAALEELAKRDVAKTSRVIMAILDFANKSSERGIA